MGDSRPPGRVLFDNSERVVIVTGGCSGIGRSICDEFLASGANVVCADSDESAGKELPEGIAFQVADVAQESDCQRVVEWTCQKFGAVDVLVNNAATMPASSFVPVDQLPAEQLFRMVAVNFNGYTFMAKHALAVMKRQQSGVVVNMASGQGRRTARQVPIYGPIKAANLLQAMQWGIDYAREGIRVVSVSPGAIDTPMVQATLELQGGRDELANRHPIGRLGDPIEVAHAVLWLASDNASFVTATDLAVDGGLNAFGAFADPYPPETMPKETAPSEKGNTT